MKQLILFISIAIVPGISFAQSKVKVFAYKQAALPATRKTTIEEGGQPKTLPPKPSFSHLIYLTVPTKKDVQPKHAWLNGKWYSLTATTKSSPVVLSHPSLPAIRTDTLVKSTAGTVLQLALHESADTFDPPGKVKSKMKSNELVVHTIEKGKDCYYYIKALKSLEPEVLQ